MRAPSWEPEYAEFFVARQRALMRTAYAILGSWAAAEDATQTTMTQMYVHWPRVQPHAGRLRPTHAGEHLPVHRPA
jgi:DNA-directed RNA polymerase specialized sigma24 family protein